MTTSNDPKTTSSPKESRQEGEGSILIGNKKISTPGQASCKHRRLYIYATLVAIALTAVGSALYSIKTQMQLRQELTQQAQVFSHQLSTLKQHQIGDKAQFDTFMSAINASQLRLQRKLSAMESVLQQRSYQTNDWLLLKIRYQLDLAKINAHWSNNWETTLALLQQADALLANIADPRLFKIRQAIAQDIIQIQSMPTVDVPGLLSQLDAALTMIANLPLKPTLTPVDKATVKKTNNGTISAWRQRLKESVSLLEELVVVRHHDEDILPLPTPAYESMLRESVRLYLQEAQWAVLQNNEPVYQFSLTQAIKKINQSFAPDATETIALLKQLRAFQQIQLIKPQPVLEQSIPLLNQFIESKDTPTNTMKPTAAGENS